MRILLVSDTHGHLNNFRTILKKVGPVDRIFHMGDTEGDNEEIRACAGCPVDIVRGNCDSALGGEPLDRILDLEGHRVFLTHGHTHGVNWDLTGLVIDARAAGADVVVFGHTHVPLLQYVDGITVINPGSASRPRQEGHRPSFAILELKAGMNPCYCSLATL